MTELAKRTKILCSGCGREMRDRKADDSPFGICDPCLKQIRGEEDELFSERIPPAEHLAFGQVSKKYERRK